MTKIHGSHVRPTATRQQKEKHLQFPCENQLALQIEEEEERTNYRLLSNSSLDPTEELKEEEETCPMPPKSTVPMSEIRAGRQDARMGWDGMPLIYIRTSTNAAEGNAIAG